MLAQAVLTNWSTRLRRLGLPVDPLFELHTRPESRRHLVRLAQLRRIFQPHKLADWLILQATLKGPDTYTKKVMGIGTANLIAYWDLADGDATARCLVDSNQNGTHTGITSGQTGIDDGKTCPRYDGVNDVTDVYTTTFRDAFDGAEGTVHIWAKVSGAGVWSDSTVRRFLTLRADANNWLALLKSNTNNRLQWYYESGSTGFTITLNSVTTAGWMPIALTWSETADQVKAYYDGSQTNSTQTSLGTWAGSLHSNYTVIGAYTNGPLAPWDGYLAHAPIWTTPLGATDIAALAVVP